MMNGMGCGGMWWTTLLTLGIFALVVWAILTMVNKNRPSAPAQGNPAAEKENALDILKRRYAHGEITKEQFERMKKDLQG